MTLSPPSPPLRASTATASAAATASAPLTSALRTGLAAAARRGRRPLDALGDSLDDLLGRPVDPRDRVLVLLEIADLQTGPQHPGARFAHHPAVARLQWELESSWLDELTETAVPADLPALGDPDDPDAAPAVVAALRALAARDRLPTVYRWVAREASWSEVVAFLALEGGPDAGFDDLVAACQVGLTGRPKLELATNYWDEMGNGDLAAVHTVLHEDLVEAIAMPRLPRDAQPLAGLERVALGALMATNHWLQPEMLGALGLIELQAGPRCRLVLQAFERLGAPAGARPFYEVHAEVDPRHGRDWMDNAIVPVLSEHPEWGPRIVRGAWWRSLLNRRFFEVAESLVLEPSPAPSAALANGADAAAAAA